MMLSTSFTICICFLVSLSAIFSSTRSWIVDSGAPRHICSNANAFVSWKPLTHATVTLPNHTPISVSLFGDVKLSPLLILKDVLHVPKFRFNLISVSALTVASHLVVSFLHDSLIIQDLHNKTMIGRGNKVDDLYILDADSVTRSHGSCPVYPLISVNKVSAIV
ncbi:hypothetical protein PanWU01x14_275680 [Parasponia andersonii]|uniref:Retrovirus-related Pol polyprotein from transposon TNT 1-94-like beta-barrel domain-containing protein n=1 Tax=Parasponia andersonii TaxID=3476 RepID=A0A2P5B369_PARAD|nr:hypothetical protein PanWU01x14_275680 [Parasponia andersonii]